MTRESRSSLAIGVAVFIAGGVLLGLEIASSRVLAPFFGNSLYVWGSLIGIVLAGLSTGVLARRHRGRPISNAAPARRAARHCRAARARDPVRRRLDAGPRRRLGPRPAAEPRDRHDPPLRPAEPRPRQRVARRGAPEGALDRGARSHGRAALRHLDGGLDRRHLPDLVLADPRARHRPGAGVGGHRPHAGGGCGGARREARDCVRTRPDARRCKRWGGRFAGARQGRDGCRLAASELVAGVPAAVSRGSQRRDRGVARPATRSSPPRTRSTTASPSSTTTPVAISASTARFRAGCTSTTRTGRASSTPTIFSFLSPTGRRRRGCSTSGSAAARPPSGPGATSPACESTSSSSTRRSSTWPTSTSSCPAIPGWPSRSRTVAATCPATRAPGT